MKIGTTIPEVANSLRRMAELTAGGSTNWNNYEQILVDVLTQVRDQAARSARSENELMPKE